VAEQLEHEDETTEPTAENEAAKARETPPPVRVWHCASMLRIVWLLLMRLLVGLLIRLLVRLLIGLLVGLLLVAVLRCLVGVLLLRLRLLWLLRVLALRILGRIRRPSPIALPVVGHSAIIAAAGGLVLSAGYG
jgi:hypothetical protein